MNNTAHFGLTDTNRLVALGVGANTPDVANLLADTAESAVAATAPINIVALFNINDLYILRGAFTDALNALDNGALGAEVATFGTEVPATLVA